MIKDVLGESETDMNQDAHDSWLLDQELIRLHQITKKTLIDTIGTLKNVYKSSAELQVSPEELNEEDLANLINSSALDVETAHMRSITDLSVAKTFDIADTFNERKMALDIPK